MAANPPVVTSVEELLAPEMLRALLGLPTGTWQVQRAAMGGGYSGAILERITLTNGDRYAGAVLKRIDPRHSWLMRAAGDTTGREIALTQSPLWSRIPTTISVPILGVARHADGSGALLMPDLTPVMYSAELCYAPADEGLVSRILEHLAALHAAFWGDPMLATTSWLATPADAFLALTIDRLGAATRDTGDEDTYGDQAFRMWPYLWRFIAADDSATILQTLMRPEALLAAATAAPVTLAHGDTWVANMGGLSPTDLWQATQTQAQQHAETPAEERLVLLDWALATTGAATFDSLWLAQTWRALDPFHVLDLHRAALLRHGVTDAADDALWALLCDLGWVRTFLMGAEWMVRDVRGATTDEADRAARERLNSWSRRTAAILRARDW
jgi:hypothetical protein